MVAYTNVTDATLTGKKAFTQAQLRINRDNDDHTKDRLDALGALTSVYDFIDTSDVSITTTVPTGTLWSSLQSITLPTKGLIVLTPYLRVDNAAGSDRNYSIGLSVNSVHHFPNIDDNGSAIYVATTPITTAEYVVLKNALRSGAAAIPGALFLDIEGYGLATGAQNVQPVVASDNGTGTQTLKGTTVTSRLKVIVFDMS